MTGFTNVCNQPNKLRAILFIYDIFVTNNKTGEKLSYLIPPIVSTRARSGFWYFKTSKHDHHARNLYIDKNASTDIMIF